MHKETNRTRTDGRACDQMREVRIKRGYLKFAEGSCLIEIGRTKVVCSVSVEDGVPPFLRGKQSGWITAEYGMLPRSCTRRIARERTKVGGRTHEIQRLIGRSLRTVVDLGLFPDKTVWIDCDVIQGDGGTRTASITGSFIALADAFSSLRKSGVLTADPLKQYVAAVSVGIVRGVPMLDLAYEEDSTAEVDMNCVMTASGEFIEIQGTAEREPFSQKQMNALLSLAKKGVAQLIVAQKRSLGKGRA